MRAKINHENPRMWRGNIEIEGRKPMATKKGTKKLKPSPKASLTKPVVKKKLKGSTKVEDSKLMMIVV